eukprot:10049350-Heterocapsa_arctica.AAC.1
MAADLGQAPQRHAAEGARQPHLLRSRSVHVANEHVQHSVDRLVPLPPDFAQRPGRAQSCI